LRFDARTWQVASVSVVVLALVIALAVALGRAAWTVSGWADVRTWPGVADAASPIGAPVIILDRRRRARPGVVLVHGILGFDNLQLGPVRVEYFRGVAARLAAAGVDVTVARLPMLGGVPERAAALAQLIAALPHERVALVAHSMGGLDARWAIAEGDAAAARIESLITIGTPHRGTPIADLFASAPLGRARAVLGRVGLPSAAVDWLTTRRAELFNREVPDAPGVRYASIVTATADRALIHPLLRVPHAYLARGHGASDGLVPASSQVWGEVLDQVEVDHWAQVGWSGGHDAASLVIDGLTRVDALPDAARRRLLTEPIAA